MHQQYAEGSEVWVTPAHLPVSMSQQFNAARPAAHLLAQPSSGNIGCLLQQGLVPLGVAKPCYRSSIPGKQASDCLLRTSTQQGLALAAQGRYGGDASPLQKCNSKGSLGNRYADLYVRRQTQLGKQHCKITAAASASAAISPVASPPNRSRNPTAGGRASSPGARDPASLFIDLSRSEGVAVVVRCSRPTSKAQQHLDEADIERQLQEVMLNLQSISQAADNSSAVPPAAVAAPGASSARQGAAAAPPQQLQADWSAAGPKASTAQAKPTQQQQLHRSSSSLRQRGADHHPASKLSSQQPHPPPRQQQQQQQQQLLGGKQPGRCSSPGTTLSSSTPPAAQPLLQQQGPQQRAQLRHTAPGALQQLQVQHQQQQQAEQHPPPEYVLEQLQLAERLQRLLVDHQQLQQQLASNAKEHQLEEQLWQQTQRKLAARTDPGRRIIASYPCPVVQQDAQQLQNAHKQRQQQLQQQRHELEQQLQQVLTEMRQVQAEATAVAGPQLPAAHDTGPSMIKPSDGGDTETDTDEPAASNPVTSALAAAAAARSSRHPSDLGAAGAARIPGSGAAGSGATGQSPPACRAVAAATAAAAPAGQSAGASAVAQLAEHTTVSGAAAAPSAAAAAAPSAAERTVPASTDAWQQADALLQALQDNAEHLVQFAGALRGSPNAAGAAAGADGTTCCGSSQTSAASALQQPDSASSCPTCGSQLLLLGVGNLRQLFS